MKAQISATETITFIGIAAMFVLLMLSIPKIFKEFFDTVATANAQVVASDMAGLISVSAVAPEDIIIRYQGVLKDINYTIDLHDGNITVQMLKDGKPISEPSENKYAIIGLQKYIENQKKFEVEKVVTNLINTYDFRSFMI